MNNDRKKRLEKLKSDKASKDMVILTNGEPFIKALASKIEHLQEVLGMELTIGNLNDFMAQLSRIESLAPAVKDLQESIETIKLPDLPDKIEVKGLDGLVKTIKELKTPKADIRVDWLNEDKVETLTKQLGNIVQAVEENKAGQSAGDFLPVRRVQKLGNAYLFDDAQWGSNGGGGGSTSSAAAPSGAVIIADAGGDQATVTGGKLDVNASVDTTGLALDATLSGAIKAEDAAHSNADKGIMALAVRSNTAASTSTSDGDYQPLITNTTGHLWVDASGQTLTVGSHAVTNAGVFVVQENGAALTALQLIDDPVATLGTTTYTEATTKGNVIGVIRRDANTSLVDTTNEVAPLQVNATGELKVAQIQALPAGTNAIGKLAANDGVDIGDVTINNASGASAVNVQDGGNSITVDGTVAATQSGTWTVQPGNTANTTAWKVDASSVAVPITDNSGSLTVDQPTGSNLHTVLDSGTLTTLTTLTGTTTLTPGTSAANLGKAEDAVHVSGDTGVMALGVRDDTLSINSGTEGDYEPFHTSAEGALWVTAIPSTTGGWTPSFNAAVTTTVKTVKASAGTLGGWFLYNPNASVAYVQIFDISGAVTLGTSVPVLSFPLPTGAGANVESPNGIQFSNAIKFACTTTATGLTAPSTGLDCNFWYK